MPPISHDSFKIKIQLSRSWFGLWATCTHGWSQDQWHLGHMPGTKKVSYLPSLKALDTGKCFSSVWTGGSKKKLDCGPLIQVTWERTSFRRGWTWPTPKTTNTFSRSTFTKPHVSQLNPKNLVGCLRKAGWAEVSYTRMLISAPKTFLTGCFPLFSSTQDLRWSACLDLVMKLKMALNSWSTFLHLPSAGIQVGTLRGRTQPYVVF